MRQAQLIAWDAGPVSADDLLDWPDVVTLPTQAAPSAEGWYAEELAEGHDDLELRSESTERLLDLGSVEMVFHGGGIPIRVSENDAAIVDQGDTVP